MYIIISLNHILYISIYIFYISPIYIYINTLILWQTGSWSFTLHENPRFAGEVCPVRRPKMAIVSKRPKASTRAVRGWTKKMRFEASKTMSEFRWLLRRDTEITQAIIWIALKVILFFGGGSKNGSAWQTYNWVSLNWCRKFGLVSSKWPHSCSCYHLDMRQHTFVEKYPCGTNFLQLCIGRIKHRSRGVGYISVKHIG